MSKIKKLSGAINIFLNKQFSNALLLLKIRKIWERIVGKAIFSHSLPYNIANNRLLVYVDDNIWVSELALREAEIKSKLNSYVKDIKIEKIFFKFNPQIKIKIKQNKNTPQRPNPILSKEKEAEIDKIVSVIEDAGLREALKTYFINISFLQKD